MKLGLVASLIIILNTCHSVNQTNAFRKAKNVESAIRSRAQLFNHLTLDSAFLGSRTVEVYFTNTLDRANPMTTHQVVEYALEPLKDYDGIDYDSLKIIFKMPRREEGDITLLLSKSRLLDEWKLFDDKKYSNAVDTLMRINASSRDSTFLESLNIEFARLTYGENYQQEAFFGLDTYKIIYGTLQECENHSYGDISRLVDSNLDRYKSADFDKKRQMEKIFRPVLNCN